MDVPNGMVGFAGRLHDVGKVAVPSSILNKPEPLTDEEMRGLSPALLFPVSIQETRSQRNSA